MINWQYINNKREVFNRIYSRKILSAIRMMLLPFIQQTRITADGNISPDIITDQPLRELYYQMYLKVGKSFIKDLTNILEKDFQDDLWTNEMEKYVEQIAGTRITLITNYTKETIRKALKKQLDLGIQNGLSIFDVMKNLRTDITKGDYSKFTKARALRIAQTEVMTASNQGSFIAANLSGYTKEKVWITTPYGVSKTERHNILDMNEQTRPMDQPFDVGGVAMMYPGDPAGGAENVINCKCTLSYK